MTRAKSPEYLNVRVQIPHRSQNQLKKIKKTMNAEDYETLPVEMTGVQIMQANEVERANIDSQVATAKQYPRNEKRSIDNSIVMATMDKETAQSCGYALPRGGKPITGPSVHLAKIIISKWGNIRAEAKVVRRSNTQIVSLGRCWDLETNVAYSVEVSRSILNKDGKRYSEDMITVTGNAANSIALRNAIFAVIPKTYVDKVYKAAQAMITGDLSDETKLLQKRTAVIKGFNETYAITEAEVIKLCGKQTINQIKTEEIALLIGMAQSLKDGDTTVDQLMKPFRLKEDVVEDKKNKMKGSGKKLKPEMM